MKKLIWGALGALCILWTGCEMDIPTDEVGKLNSDAFCVLTGGKFDPQIERCICGADVCGENVTCVQDTVTKEFTCAGMAYTLLPSGPCMMDKVIVCANRINSKGASIGYYTQCIDNSWTPEASCEGDRSCMIYAFTEKVMSSKCGTCQDDGITCVAGQSITE